jgi:uncharacterized cupin superfamily protein
MVHTYAKMQEMVPEGQLERTEHGLVPADDGWFVVNAADARWRERTGRGVYCDLEGDADFAGLGVNIQVLQPGQPMAMYHWERDQEDFLVLAGQGTAVIEGERRELRRWDFVHCPAGAQHVIVATGDEPLVVLCVGARTESTGPNWGAYTVDETAVRLNAGVEHETNDPDVAYARFAGSRMTPYQSGWLPE